jgi:hypothetical protein
MSNILKQSDVIVTRNDHNGSYECAALVNGTRVSRVYYFYTKRESVRRFTREVNKEHEDKYQPKTGVKCGCRRGIERDNCPACEGTGQRIDFALIHRRRLDNA